MARLASLLRGINVGTARKIPMPELRAMYERLGFANVASYIQSGNVVFDTDGGASAAEIAARIENALAERFGFDDIDVTIRDRAALDRIVDSNPFVTDDADPKTLHVTFLNEAPDARRFADVHDETGSEALSIGPDAVIYLFLPDGIGRSNFAAKVVRMAGPHATTRNWRTTLTLQQMLTS